jgi:hypothetical protein
MTTPAQGIWRGIAKEEFFVHHERTRQDATAVGYHNSLIDAIAL